MITVVLPYNTGRSGRVQTRKIDLREPAHVDDLLRYISGMSDGGVREVLAAIDALPEYAKAWYGTQRVLKEIAYRLRSAS